MGGEDGRLQRRGYGGQDGMKGEAKGEGKRGRHKLDKSTTDKSRDF